MESLEEETKIWALGNFTEDIINKFLDGFHQSFINDNFQIPLLELLLSSTMKKNVQVDRSKSTSIPDNYFNLFNRLGYSDNNIIEATKHRKSKTIFHFDSVYQNLIDRVSPSLIIKKTIDRELLLSKFL